MKTKNFLVCGIAGGIVDFLLGWLFYGILFKDFFPVTSEPDIFLIFLGCLSIGFMISYIFTGISYVSSASSGLKAGAVIGFFLALYGNFFMYAFDGNIDYQLFALDVAVITVMIAIVGAAIAVINGKLK